MKLAAHAAVVTVLLAAPAAVIAACASGQVIIAQELAITVPTSACHDVVFPASAAGSWVIPGGGVNVFSNGPADEGTGAVCSASLSRSNGQEAGLEWQCAELINRLYLTRGWIKAPSSRNQVSWPGDAGPAFYRGAPGNLAKQANGSVSYLGPGDVIIISVLLNGRPDGGQALVVNDRSDVAAGTVNLVSQNSGHGAESAPVVPGSLTRGQVTVGGAGGGYSYTTVGVVHAPTAPAAAWKAAKAPLPAGAATNASPALNEVACPSVTVCVAVGSYGSGPSGYGQGLLLTRSGSSWTATEAPLPPSTSANRNAELSSVACPSAAVCVAAGSYTDSSGHGQGVLLTGHGSSWVATKAPLPRDAADDPAISFAAVACPSTTVCVAASSYTDASGVEQGLLVTGHGTTWAATKAPMPAGAASRPLVGLSHIACPSTTMCVVTGVYSDSPRSYQGLLLSGHGSSWAAANAPVPPGAAIHPDVDISDVACTPTAVCVVTGNYYDSSVNAQGLLLTAHGPSWSAAKAPRPAGVAIDQPVDLGQVACPSATRCVSVGQYSGSSGSNQGLLLTGWGPSWTAARAPLPAGTATSQNAALSDVACPSATACVAAGSYTAATGNQPGLLLTEHGSSWIAIKAPLPASALLYPAPVLSDVTCPSATSCVATGYYTDSAGNQQGLLLTGPA